MALDENSSKQIIRAKIPLLRKRLGFTQDEIAEKLNISRSTYAYYESKAPKIPPEILNQLAVIFNIEPEDFLPPNVESPIIKFASPRSEYAESYNSVDENMILMIYRKLNEEDRAKYLKQLVDRYSELVQSGEISEDII
jgi:transcriptional regulator with XRE-family HTH domain